ncbi:MAG TPA: pentapeptide repeat-containing protein, partial [Spirochaetota bacterium]|nr:pentapeptide repeat-containing protein [Spirochaetota bacterium]
DDCVINSCDFCGMKLKKTPFTKCEIIATDFVGTDLTGVDFSRTIFRDAGFDKTNLSGANFTDARGYAINPVANNVRKAKFSLPDAVTLLEIMGIIIK